MGSLDRTLNQATNEAARGQYNTLLNET